MITRVLKDLDFNRLEGQIEIDSVLAKELRNQLRIDTSFLTDLNIIDYSLLLMRVNWKT
jgi:1-phosphatidylinositol-4-phosphate 5-kinase